MPTIIDRLFGREPEQKAVVEAKATTGPGVLAWYNDTSLWSASKNPRKLMQQAQSLYHRDLVIRAAERRVSSAATNLPWHLEDENQDEVTDESPDEQRRVWDWLRKPQQALPLDRRQTGASTQRELWFLTSRHAGLCGSAFWYLDQRTAVTGQALATLYINPARMYPVTDPEGFVRGWKLDADEEGNGGIPLELSEVRHFLFEPPDFGHFGIGLVESGGSSALLAESIERHATSVIRGGARLAGLISPKPQTTVTDDQWDAAARDWRRITSDPDSAKRLHILRAPVDYTRTSATMQELAVEALYKMSREDKLALWGVPASQVPFPMAAGLNSGETKGFDEAVLYQGAVHDRVEMIRTVIQTTILDPITESGGPALTLIIEEPEFDDETPLYERAAAAKDQPLTVNERRAIIGLDPLPDVDAQNEPLGTAIWLPIGLTMVGAGPDENGNLIALPEPEPPPAALAAPSPDEAPPPSPEAVPAKATLEGLRKRVERRVVKPMTRDMAAALREQAQAVAKRIRSRGVGKSKGAWWDSKAEDARIRRVLEKHNLATAELVTEQVPALLPRKADPFVDSVMTFVKTRTGERVTGINQTTQDAIADLIEEGIADGLGPDAVADSIVEAGIFDEARAELVARTESMFAYNDAALSSYREFDVKRVTAIDGDQDAECADRNGREYSVDDAFDVVDHPNGTLDWAPVI